MKDFYTEEGLKAQETASSSTVPMVSSSSPQPSSTGSAVTELRAHQHQVNGALAAATTFYGKIYNWISK